jgi:hypothetical protein
MNLLMIPLKELLNSLTTPLEIFKNLKKIIMATTPNNFVSIVISFAFSTKPINGFSRQRKRKRYPKKEAIVVG